MFQTQTSLLSVSKNNVRDDAKRCALRPRADVLCNLIHRTEKGSFNE
jgi:hypothetical protein